MTSKRAIIFEAALATAFLTTGMMAAKAAHAAPVTMAAQAANSDTANRQANVKIESRVQIERSSQDVNGNVVTSYHNPDEVKVVPGDRLVFINSYRNVGGTPVTGFVINNPLHPAVAFDSVAESWAELSVDGGKTFGRLDQLTVTSEAAPDTSTIATRAAQPADVTHIRWTFAEAIPAGKSGELQFKGIVK